MDIKRLLELQAKRGAKAMGLESSRKTIAWVINDCRRYIQDSSDSYRELDSAAKVNALKDIIIKYVMSNNLTVEGFVDERNRPDTNRLVDRLVEDITDYGILTPAIQDADIYEIRGNEKEIKVETKGKVSDLKDKDGRIISFESVEQQDVILRKLLGDVRLTPKDALVNSRTVEGYRIAAVHSSAVSPDPLDPTADRYHSFVLRKFKKSKMGLDEIVRQGTMSDGMARLLALLPAGGLTWFTAGPTASGKTTTNNAILQAVPPTTRTILIQNPSEIDLRKRDASGRIYNDAIHLEGRDKDNPSPSDPTMQNLMNHTLRLSPTFVCFGELRSNEEFKLGMQIAQAGHPINCTFHAESSKGAIRRFLTAYLAVSGNEPSHLALMTLTELVKIIIIQKIMRDGTRKVIQISEILGVDRNNVEEPLINDLYIFDVNEEPEYDIAGNLLKIRGVHKRVGVISDGLVRKLDIEGVSPARYKFLREPIGQNEIEDYTGMDIVDYGKYPVK